MTTLSTPPATILTISVLTELIKETLEDNFAEVWVRGEISNLSMAASGHWYLTLKDEQSQIRCAMFRTTNRRVAFRPENGQQVICRGRISLYSQRGDVQFLCESMEIEGRGSLQVAFEQLKQQLATEGLFDAAHKQPLPAYPRTIGVVTSASGAAIHDIMNILARRAAGIRIILRPVLVQGNQAAAEIAEAIHEFNAHHQAEVVIVGRGGGSLEDLQAFNSEHVARAIHASRIPIISAVGHETDYTIADFVADLRAPTPSAAAELVVKNRQELEQHIDQLGLRLQRVLDQRCHLAREKLENLQRRLRSPLYLLQLKQQRFQELSQRLKSAFTRRQEQCRHALQNATGQLEALSPLHTLERGFAVISPALRPTVMLRYARQLHAGDEIIIRFSDGRRHAVISTDRAPSNVAPNNHDKA